MSQHRCSLHTCSHHVLQAQKYPSRAGLEAPPLTGLKHLDGSRELLEPGDVPQSASSLRAGAGESVASSSVCSTLQQTCPKVAQDV